MGDMLEDRLRAIEDRNTIVNLKARYINACDGGWNRFSHNADLVASLFTPDGVWQAENQPPAVGREAIRELFSSFSAEAPFVFHCITNPLIEVRGDRATGEWHLSEVFIDAQGVETWAGGIYTDTFERGHDGWLFKTMSVTYAYFGPYKSGLKPAIRRSLSL